MRFGCDFMPWPTISPSFREYFFERVTLKSQVSKYTRRLNDARTAKHSLLFRHKASAPKRVAGSQMKFVVAHKLSTIEHAY